MKKKKLKSILRNFAFKNHLQIKVLDAKDDLEKFLFRFREKYVSCDLIRVGGESDGGYLIPNVLDEIQYCFSPGSGNNASFEKELSKRYNIKSFILDGSITSPPQNDKNFSFASKYLGTTNNKNVIKLSNWINESIGGDKGKKILQMDIEGDELEVLIFEDKKILESFSIMIIEFHHMQRIYEKSFLKIFSSIFEKIYHNFYICHVAPNNSCGMDKLDNIKVPRAIEITFINKNILKYYQNDKKVKLPNILDRKNSMEMKEILMPEIWWKK